MKKQPARQTEKRLVVVRTNLRDLTDGELKKAGGGQPPPTGGCMPTESYMGQ